MNLRGLLSSIISRRHIPHSCYDRIFAYITSEYGGRPVHHRTCDADEFSSCRAVGVWAGQEDKDAWCENHCRAGDCPPALCSCDEPPVYEDEDMECPLKSWIRWEQLLTVICLSLCRQRFRFESMISNVCSVEMVPDHFVCDIREYYIIWILPPATEINCFNQRLFLFYYLFCFCFCFSFVGPLTSSLEYFYRILKTVSE